MFTYEPTRAVGDPKSLWTFASDGGFYEQAFGIEGEAVEFWPEAEFNTLQLALAFFIGIESKIDEAIKKDRASLYLRRLRYFALALAKEFLVIRYPTGEWDQLLKSEAEFKKLFNEFWRDASRALVDAHHQATEEDKTTLFALARSDQRWRATKERFARYLKLTV